MNRVAVIGAGSWGATLASLLVHQQQKVYLWTHSPNHIPDTQAHVSTSLEEVLKECKVAVIVVASEFYRSTIKKVIPLLPDECYILSATKGLETDTGKRMSEILNELLPRNYHKKIAVLSGPNLAKEILAQKPAASVIASKNEEAATYFQQLLSASYFRVYTNSDVIGVELGGTLKNIFAIAAGIADGFNFGTNAKSALMVRGIAEMSRLGTALGAKQSTFYGLSGIGDLITTCSSPLSRNYQVGLLIAKGEKLADIEESRVEVAEGINTTRVAATLGKQLSIELPIVEQMYEVLYKGKDPYDAVLNLMLRDLKSEA
ncbi:MAG: NAD(P)H-dependent glycerol-3-phosphate dehydrogenase [Candidatus Margulisiibacteriota bacterium]